MPTQTLENRSARVIATCAPDAPDRFTDVRLEVRCDATCSTPGRLIGYPVGGRWDALERRYVGPGATTAVIGAHPGQVETYEAWFRWLRGYVTDDWRDWQRHHGARPYSFWLVGGRRRGKTYVGVATVALFAVACAGSYPWIASETEDDFNENAEIPRYWRRLVPSGWYEWDPYALAIQIVNGSRVELRSAHDPQNLKAGEASYAFQNEAQKRPQVAYDNLRGATSDSGSVVLVAANPPRAAIGYWSLDMVEKLRRGEVDGYLREYHDPNPHVVESSLDAMRKEMSARDYAIEREGRFLTRTDVVMHAFELGERGNVRPEPQVGEVTDPFLRRKLGRPFAAVVGADFQLTPHMAGCIFRFYLDPDDPTDALAWTVDEAVVEQGDEDDLVDALEGLGFRGDECVVIPDASGAWQQGDRRRGRVTGRGSWDMLRARGWRHIVAPSPWQKGNPLVIERAAVGNARLRSHDGRQHAFLDPRCVATAEALQKWPTTKQGVPSRHTQYAHLGDAWTYPLYRLWPRRMQRREVAAEKVRLINIHGRDDRAFT